MSGRSGQVLFVLVLAALWAAGCATTRGPVGRAETAEEIYGRGSGWFTNVIFFKPELRVGEELATTLAPLILEWVPEENPQPGTGPTSVYVATDVVELDGRAHARLAYYWQYAPGSGRAGLAAQGVRITVDSAGRPVIWEALADTSSKQILFVAESLEKKASASFGRPLPGRHYAIEANTNVAPDIVVARIIDDGPVPMGPILYVRADTHDIRTLICRCMPAQATSILGTRTYQLVHLEALTGQFADAVKGTLSGVQGGAPIWAPAWGDAAVRGLRLPSDW